MFSIVRDLYFFLKPDFDSLKAGIFEWFFEEARIQLGDDIFSEFFVGIEVGGVRPPHKQIMRE